MITDATRMAFITLVFAALSASSTIGIIASGLQPQDQHIHSGLTSRRNVVTHTFLIGSGAMTAAAVTSLVSQPALAERSLESVTESYKRYVPRMESGFRFLGSDLKEMIVKGETAGIIFELTSEKGTTISAMKGTMKVRKHFISENTCASQANLDS